MSCQLCVLLVFIAASCNAIGPLDLLHAHFIGHYVEEDVSSNVKPARQPIYEWVDYGRFLEDRTMFVRVNISQHWIRPEPGMPWRDIDLGGCHKSTPRRRLPEWSRCKPEAVVERHQCTPVTLVQCGVDARLTPFGFTDTSIRFENGTWIIATKHRLFNVRERNAWREYAMPATGVIAADVPLNTVVKIGSLAIVRDTTTIAQYAHTGIATTDLVLDPAKTFGEPKTCKTVVLAINETDEGPDDCHDCYREGFFYLRCGDVTTGVSLLLYVAAIAAIVFVAGGTPFVVRFVYKRTRRGERYLALYHAEAAVKDGVENEKQQDLLLVAPHISQQPHGPVKHTAVRLIEAKTSTTPSPPVTGSTTAKRSQI